MNPSIDLKEHVKLILGKTAGMVMWCRDMVMWCRDEWKGQGFYLGVGLYMDLISSETMNNCFSFSTKEAQRKGKMGGQGLGSWESSRMGISSGWMVLETALIIIDTEAQVIELLSAWFQSSPRLKGPSLHKQDMQGYSTLLKPFMNICLYSTDVSIFFRLIFMFACLLLTLQTFLTCRHKMLQYAEAHYKHRLSFHGAS